MIVGLNAKAISAFIAGAIGFATLVVQSAPSSITAEEWIVAGTYLSTVVLVYVVPNAAKSDV